MYTIFFFFLMFIGAFVILYERYIFSRSFKERKAFFQTPSKDLKRIFSFVSISLITSIIFLLILLSIAFQGSNFGKNPSSIAIVLDTSNIILQDKLSLEKNIVESFLRYIRGVQVSLYEAKSGKIALLCPATIDPLFFRLMLETIQISGAVGTISSLQSIQQEVEKKEEFDQPYCIVIQSDTPTRFSESVHDMSVFSIQEGKVSFTMYGKFGMQKYDSIEEFSKDLRYLLFEKNDCSVFSKKNILLCSFLSIFSYLFYLIFRYYTPVLAGATICLFASYNFCSDEISSNSLSKEAIDLAASGAYNESSELFDKLLNETTTMESQRNIMYDRAMIAYMQNDPDEALRLLSKVPISQADKDRGRFDVLEGLSHIKALQQAIGEAEKEEKRKMVLTWLLSSTHVSQDLLKNARLAVLRSEIQSSLTVSNTLCWLQNFFRENSQIDSELFFQCARKIVCKTQQIVLEFLQKFFCQETEKQFLDDCSHISDIAHFSKLSLWYYISQASSVHEGIEALFEQGCMFSNAVSYFPSYRKITDDTLVLVEKLLSVISQKLPENEKDIFTSMNRFSSKEMEMTGALYFAKKILYPAISEGEKSRYKAVLRILRAQEESALSDNAKKALAIVASFICKTDVSKVESSEDPLRSCVAYILYAWYEDDPVSVFDFLLQQMDLQQGTWDQDLHEVVLYSLKNEKLSSPLRRFLKSAYDEPSNHFGEKLFARLWQLSLIATDTKQGFVSFLEHLLSYCSFLHEEMSRPDIVDMQTFCLTVLLFPKIAAFLKNGEGYVDPEKKQLYLETMQKLFFYMKNLEEMVLNPEQFRIQKVLSLLSECETVLKEMITIFSENLEKTVGPESLSEQSVAPAFSKTSAVTLFQELERADRELL